MTLGHLNPNLDYWLMSNNLSDISNVTMAITEGE